MAIDLAVAQTSWGSLRLAPFVNVVVNVVTLTTYSDEKEPERREEERKRKK